MAKKLMINADDLGFSLGFNHAILTANTKGFLSHASLMANTQYFDHAVEKIIPNCKNFHIGVHVNLTCAKALDFNSLLIINGYLKNDFVKLLFKRKKVLDSIEKEIELQILKIQEKGINISHIASHEHIHIIPSINRIV